MRELQAAEERDLDGAAGDVPAAEERLRTLLRRFEPWIKLEPGAAVLEIGAAQGVMQTALVGAGFDAVGLEPWEGAIATSRELADRTGVQTELVQGYAEELPFEAERFDLMLAESVLEHVRDPLAVFLEAYRVLRSGGGFYFYASSALGWRQDEIARFPFFPWYPDRVRRRIMNWAARERPDLVGGTTMPAVNWFTPRGVRRDLGEIGFTRVVDRWRLRRDSELTGVRRAGLRAGRSLAPARFIGEVVAPGSGFLALK